MNKCQLFIRAVARNTYLFLRMVFLKGALFFLSKDQGLPDKNEIKRILIIRLDRLGDMVLSTPMIQSVRMSYPSAHIMILANDLTKDIVDGAPFVDEVLVFEKGMDLKGLKADLVFDLIDDYTLKSAILTNQTKAKYRVGFDVAGRGVFFNITVKPRTEGRHFVEAVSDLVDAVNGDIDQKGPFVVVKQESKGTTERFFTSEGISTDDLIIAVHPGATYQTRRWPLDRFAEMADQLIDQMNAKVIFIGSKYEEELIVGITSSMTNEPILFTCKPICDLIALINGCDLLICNNSGPLHIADALETPTVSMMGPAKFERWKPYGEGHIILRRDELPCIGCGSGICKINTIDCMGLISVEDVFDAVKNSLIKINKKHKTSST